MYLQVLSGRERLFGKNHPLTLEAVNNLGIIYHDQGKLEGALLMYKRALLGKEKTHGSFHMSTLQTANNLGWYIDHVKLCSSS